MSVLTFERDGSVDLAVLGWDLPPEHLRRMARWVGETPKAFARGVAEAIREAYLEIQEALPYPTWAIARAIEARMKEE